jgi:translation initiation factor 1
VSIRDEEEGFEDIVAELDREEARVKVRMEMRRFRKPTTVIEGLKMNEKDLQELGTKMKKMLATGGTVKDGLILLQGDHRDRVIEILVKDGFSESSIEVI